MHEQDTADAFTLAFSGVVDIAAAFQGPGINTEEGQLTDIRVGHNLKSQGGEGFFIAGMAGCLGPVRQDTVNRGNVCRRRSEINNTVQQKLYALVFESGATENRNGFVGNGCFTQGFFDVFNGDVFTFKVFFHEVFIGFSNAVQHSGAVFFNLVRHICRNIHFFIVNQVFVVEELISLHFDQVN